MREGGARGEEEEEEEGYSAPSSQCESCGVKRQRSGEERWWRWSTGGGQSLWRV